MGDDTKKDAETSTFDLPIDITRHNLEKFEKFLVQISKLKFKFTELEDVVNLVVSENSQIIKSENSRMEEQFELLEQNNQIKLKMMIQELEMNTKLEQIKQKYNYLNADAVPSNISSMQSTTINQSQLSSTQISKSAPPPPPPPPNPNFDKKSQKDLIAPVSGTDVQSQLKAALASKFKNANG